MEEGERLENGDSAQGLPEGVSAGLVDAYRWNGGVPVTEKRIGMFG